MKEKLYYLFKENNIEIDKDIFEYGCKILKTYLIYFSFLIPIAYLLDVVFESIIFIFFYTPLKRYIGGFHFNTPKLCTLFSIFTTLIIAFASKNVAFENILPIYIITLFLFFVSFKIGTMDHPNKRLSTKEKKVYTKNALIIELIYLILIQKK